MPTPVAGPVSFVALEIKPAVPILQDRQSVTAEEEEEEARPPQMINQGGSITRPHTLRPILSLVYPPTAPTSARRRRQPQGRASQESHATMAWEKALVGQSAVRPDNIAPTPANATRATATGM